MNDIPQSQPISASLPLARRLPPPLAVALALVAMAAGRSGAQEPQSSPDTDIYSETVNVEVINIDVYVRDKDGNPVEGLTKDDFELEIDGKPVPISNFYTIDSRIQSAERGVRLANRAAAPPDAQERQSEPADLPVQSNRPSDRPKEQQLHVVVYIDNFNLTPFKRNKVMSELREFLRNQLSTDDQVMLATYDRSLHLRQPFTARPENIARAMVDLEAISAQGIHTTRERVEVIRKIEDADTVSEALNYAFDWAGARRNDLSFTIDAMRSVVDNLAAASGRKAIVYVSEGLPMIAGEEMFYAVQQKFKEETSMNYMSEYDMSRRFRELANQANANRVSFYTIDASGLSVLSQGTVDYDIVGAAGERTFFDSVYRSNMQSTLQMLAERTGGRAIINTNRFLPDLEKVALDFKSYYSLGYVHPESTDGRLHYVKVVLPQGQRGWDVRYRDTYRAKSIGTRMHDGTLSALHLDLQDNPLDARIDFSPPQPAANGLFNVRISVKVPLKNLALLPGAGVHRGDLRLWFVAKDQDDQMSDVQELPVKVEIPDDQLAELQDSDYEYSLTLLMDEGYHDIAIGLLDAIGAQRSFIRRGLGIGASGRSRGR